MPSAYVLLPDPGGPTTKCPNTAKGRDNDIRENKETRCSEDASINEMTISAVGVSYTLLSTAPDETVPSSAVRTSMRTAASAECVASRWRLQIITIQGSAPTTPAISQHKHELTRVSRSIHCITMNVVVIIDEC